MADTFNINLTEVEQLATRMKSLPDVLTQRIRLELQDGAQAIASEAIQRSPGNNGILRNEIGYEKEDDLNFVVFSNALYSAYVEFGTRANVDIPPGLEAYAAQFIGSPGASSLSAKEAIFEWCRQRGIDEKAWYAIYVTLLTNGGQPHPFFFPAVNRILPIITNRITEVLLENAFQ
jgi:HK97 gp10 family phage protein